VLSPTGTGCAFTAELCDATAIVLIAGNVGHLAASEISIGTDLGDSADAIRITPPYKRPIDIASLYER
jgi:hypothetical protein